MYVRIIQEFNIRMIKKFTIRRYCETYNDLSIKQQKKTDSQNI